MQPTVYHGTSVPLAYPGVSSGAPLPTTNWIQPGSTPAGSMTQARGVPMQTMTTPLPTSIPVSSLPTTIAPATIPFTYSMPTSTYAPGYYPGLPQGSSQPLAMPMPTVPLQPPATVTNSIPQASPEMPSSTVGAPVATPASTSVGSQLIGTPTNTPVAVQGMPGGVSPSAVATQSFVLTSIPGASPVQTGVPTQSLGSRKGNGAVDLFGVQSLPDTSAAVPAELPGEGSESLDEATVQTQSLKNLPQYSRKTKRAKRRWICC